MSTPELDASFLERRSLPVHRSPFASVSDASESSSLGVWRDLMHASSNGLLEVPARCLQHADSAGQVLPSPATRDDLLEGYTMLRDAGLLGCYEAWIRDTGTLCVCPSWCVADHPRAGIYEQDEYGPIHDAAPVWAVECDGRHPVGDAPADAWPSCLGTDEARGATPRQSGRVSQRASVRPVPYVGRKGCEGRGLMVEVLHLSRVELVDKRSRLLDAIRMTSLAELEAANGVRELTPDEQDALDELRGIAFLLGEE